MSEQSATDGPEIATPAMSVEDILRAELDYGDAMLGTVGAILGHLVLNHDQSLFTDAIIARVRGMLADVSRQMLEVESEHLSSSDDGDTTNPSDDDGLEPDALARSRQAERIETLSQSIASDPDFLLHCHALAIEFQASEKLKGRNSLDPVLTPLLQSFIASKDEKTASNAMAALAAQARFMEQQRRMVLPMEELPLPLARHAIACWHAAKNVEDEELIATISTALRNKSRPERARTELFADLLKNMGGGTAGALSIPHAGLSLFISALAITSGMTREDAVLATNERQMARLALSLKGAGLKSQTIEEQFLYLHPEIELPEDFDILRAETARSILSGAAGTNA